jgi:hypothetical protein
MLSDKEKEFLKEILFLMTEKDLQLLAQTITDNMIAPLTIKGKLMSKDVLKWMSMLSKNIYTATMKVKQNEVKNQVK